MYVNSEKKKQQQRNEFPWTLLMKQSMTIARRNPVSDPFGVLPGGGGSVLTSEHIILSLFCIVLLYICLPTDALFT